MEVHLNKHRPSIICLQETRRLNTDKRIHINRYSIEEVPIGDTGLGLLMGIRNDSNLIPKVTFKIENIIAMSVKNYNTNLIVINAYRNNKGSARKETMESIVEILKKHKNDNITGIIVTDDWNSLPDVEIL